MTSKYTGKLDAPGFPNGGEWLNSPLPLTLGDFSGKLLLLEFWTYCCISCLHLIPTLSALGRKYPEEVAIVGVHTAKFIEERTAENVRQAMMRHGVGYAVVNDASGYIWNAYAVRSWPTLVFVSPAGKVIGKFEGELTYDQGVILIDEMLAEFRAADTLHPRAGANGQIGRQERSVLSYPGKVLADVENERLFISDSGHHRILLTDLDGVIQTVIGSGFEGLTDGLLEGAQFSRPQGLAISGDALYVADTGNHSIRYVDLEVGIVETIAGTGSPGVGRVEGGAALQVDLRSPRDLALAGRNMHVAMAGSHQIWTLNLDTHIIQATVGTGAKSIVDGPPEAAVLAQPSGVCVDEDDMLFFLDSETSALRSADSISTHHVSTLVGSGLFDFGDRDGDSTVARFQHPLGIDYLGGIVFVADTYNHKIKRYGTDTLAVVTVAGTGEPGEEDGPMTSSSFYEPGGLSVTDNQIYVADTNNNAVRVIDLITGMVSTLEVDF